MSRALKDQVTGTGPVVTQTKQQAAKSLAKDKAKPDLKVTGKPAEAPKPVAPTVKVEKDPKKVAEEIEMLLDDLRTSTDAEEKKRIRRKLRIRGHFGGLSKEREEAKKAEAVKETAAK